jgi:hypothetical protein
MNMNVNMNIIINNKQLQHKERLAYASEKSRRGQMDGALHEGVHSLQLLGRDRGEHKELVRHGVDSPHDS